MKKRNLKKYSLALFSSMSILAPITLVSCASSQLQKNQEKEQENKNTTNMANSKETLNNSNNKTNDSSSSKKQEKNESSMGNQMNLNTLKPKVDEKTNQKNTNQMEKTPQQGPIKPQDEAEDKTQAKPNQPQKDTNEPSKMEPKPESKPKNNENAKANSKDKNNQDSLAKKEEKPKTQEKNLNNSQKELENKDSKNDDQIKDGNFKWWNTTMGQYVELIKADYNGQNLTLHFKDELAENIESSIFLNYLNNASDESNKNTKRITFKTLKSKIQTISLEKEEINDGKWEISHFLFNVYQYMPTNKFSFEVRKKAKLLELKLKEIENALANHDFSIDEKNKNKANVSNYKLHDFNLNFKMAKVTENQDLLKFSGLDFSPTLDIETNLSISLESVVEDEKTKQRSANFKIIALENQLINKVLNWTYKSNKDYLAEFSLEKSEIKKELETKVSNFFFDNFFDPTKANIYAYKLPETNPKIKDFDLKDEIKATFLNYESFDNFQGSVLLRFKISRGNYHIEATISISGFLKVGFLESKEEKTSNFDLKASSFENGHESNKVFEDSQTNNNYWKAKSSNQDSSPWLELAWKEGYEQFIYGIDLLFLDQSDYYKKDSYKVEYKESVDGEWQNLEISQREILKINDNQNYVKERIILKKDRVHAIRITFLADKKPKNTSIFGLNPIITI
ncbi:hypothetical protein [Mycoplasmopsis pulmonis]|uniref:hypothetical protein n=1 Tax=Mycoplasmopsis pulmonis TaxID=2107 RepID=UPI002ACE33F5|nr:hypothetical protein [Mycoplasmopsis pulmonis]MDZ7293482.1 hypothetical protein [Mycoplasmopsis pulmonis]